jgi:hypothetical protein
MYSVHNFLPYFPEINSNIISPSMPFSSKLFFPFRFLVFFFEKGILMRIFGIDKEEVEESYIMSSFIFYTVYGTKIYY